jgi:uncharacterized protein YdiU (UPF0061 family)
MNQQWKIWAMTITTLWRQQISPCINCAGAMINYCQRLASIPKPPATITSLKHLACLSLRPLLALRYHGYQFGEYNPQLGDGRGFLYGQVRGKDGDLYDFGTKGSGNTPYSRSADGRLTLKGGVREILAAEALHRLGVNTSRCLSMIETGEQLWRGDEPSPTRSCVMVRFSKSHIRFGTFERLYHIGRADFAQKLLDHVIEIYYPHLLARVISKPATAVFMKNWCSGWRN